MKIYLLIGLFSFIISQNSYINYDYYAYLKRTASFNVASLEKNKFFHYTDEQIRSLFTLDLKNSDYLTNPNKYKDLKYKPTPGNALLEFDSRTNPDWVDYNCVPEIRDQGDCGSCWALSGATTLGWRFCISSEGKINKVLSPQYSVSCDTGNYGCNGGYLDLQWEFLESNGLPTEQCYPYVSCNGTTTKCVENYCEDGSEWKTYKSLKARNYIGDLTIRDAIEANGPIQAGMYVYSDFMYYESGIYTHESGDLLGGHAVVLLGWGYDEASLMHYWIAQNSWGTEWGENGYFRIAFGECGIQDEGIAGLPNLDELKKKKKSFE